jgi:DNA invertase Pin-like site-specific DNA recombinase
MPRSPAHERRDDRVLFATRVGRVRDRVLARARLRRAVSLTGARSAFPYRTARRPPDRGFLTAGDTLIVRRLDRIGRRTGELVRLVTDLAARDIGVRSLTEPIDTTTPSGNTILDALAAFAQTEANLVRESTHAGLAIARARGRRGGRPTVVTPDRLAEAHRLREAGSSFSEIAQALAIGRATVSRALTATSVPDPDNEATDQH